jgi:hypothetical protein
MRKETKSNSEVHVNTLANHLPEVFAVRATDIFDDWLVAPIDVERYEPQTGTDQWLSTAPINRSPGFFSQDNSNRSPLETLIQALGRYPGAPILAKPEPDIPIPPDAAAFYLPFHYFPQTWGIYLIVEMLEHEVQRLQTAAARNAIELAPKEARDIVQTFLYSHEAFHHNVECFATRGEIVFRKPFYKAGFQKYYEDHLKDEILSEEALANGYAYQKLFATTSKIRKHYHWEKGQPKLTFLTQYFKDYFKRSPGGYKGGLHYLTPKKLETGEYTLAEGSWRETMKVSPQPIPLPKNCPADVWSAFPHALHGFATITSRVKYLIHKSGRKETLRLNWQPLQRT